jgi:hypothetical protein
VFPADFMTPTIAIGLLALMLIPGAADEPRTPQEQFQTLKRDYGAAFEAFVKASDQAKTEADAARVANHPGRNPRGFAGGFMAPATKHPRTEAAEESLVWVASHVMFGPET